jgi:hypothetical protein
MCKLIATLTLLLVFSISLFGTNVVPVVDLPTKPTKQLMSKLNNNTDLYVEKVLNYYTASVCYEAQLNLMGIKPTKEVIAPTLEQLSKPSQKVLQFQWKQASDLHKQIASIEVTAENPNIAAFRSNIYELQVELAKLRADSAKLSLALKELDIYPELYENTLYTINKFKEQVNRYTIPTLGVSVGATTLLFSDDMVGSTAGVNLGLVFNPTPLLGIGNFFDVWFDYSNPNIKTNHYSNYGNLETLTHNTNILSLGANIVLPLSKIFEVEKYYWTIKGGAGYYWIDDKTPNTIVNNNLWKGVVLKVEMEFVNLASRFPFGVYASATFNHTNADLTLDHPDYYYYYNNIAFGNKWFNSLNAGLRFYLTGSCK